jgi:hypothetical protein
MAVALVSAMIGLYGGLVLAPLACAAALRIAVEA